MADTEAAIAEYPNNRRYHVSRILSTLSDLVMRHVKTFTKSFASTGHGFVNEKWGKWRKSKIHNVCDIETGIHIISSTDFKTRWYPSELYGRESKNAPRYFRHSFITINNIIIIIIIIIINNNALFTEGYSIWFKQFLPWGLLHNKLHTT